MKVSGPLTHARYVAELARIVRIASKAMAHEALRMHEGIFQPADLADGEESMTIAAEIEAVVTDIRR